METLGDRIDALNKANAYANIFVPKYLEALKGLGVGAEIRRADMQLNKRLFKVIPETPITRGITITLFNFATANLYLKIKASCPLRDGSGVLIYKEFNVPLCRMSEDNRSIAEIYGYTPRKSDITEESVASIFAAIAAKREELMKAIQELPEGIERPKY